MVSALHGRTVLVPRPKHQAQAMVQLIEEHGATALVVPTIAITQPRDTTPLEGAIKELIAQEFDWVFFTSVNAVQACVKALETLPTHHTQHPNLAAAIGSTKVAAVGNTTKDALLAHGVAVHLQPPATEQHAAGLVAAFAQIGCSNIRAFLPRADIASSVLPEGLSALGVQVVDVSAYRTVRAEPPPEGVIKQIVQGEVDAICFSAGSTVRNFLELIGAPHPETTIACIGPMCADTARGLGLQVDVMPDIADVPHLIASLEEYFSHRTR